jgi:hypothetical protein
VVKAGGWVCARTPNRWGYIALAARVIPNRWHITALRALQPHKLPEDTFPTAYRVNTPAAFERHFGPWFDVVVYPWDAEPSYGSDRVRALLRALRYLPAPLRSTWMVFLRRR